MTVCVCVLLLFQRTVFRVTSHVLGPGQPDQRPDRQANGHTQLLCQCLAVTKNVPAGQLGQLESNARCVSFRCQIHASLIFFDVERNDRR